MLSLPHLVVLFVVALMVFGPEKLPELARMLGKATAEFRKMTSDFRYALEDEVRELERQTRIKEEEAAAAARAAQPATPPTTPAAPEGSVPRDTSINAPATDTPADTAAGPTTPELYDPQHHVIAPPESENAAAHSSETVSVPHEKTPADDNTVV
jgi:sec-independent protein translocase protein TatB